MDLDKAIFPRAARYLSGLPEGLSSFAECEVHADVLTHLRRTHAELGRHPGLPSSLARVLTRPQDRQWFPEVWCNTILLALRDVALADDDAFLGWALASSSEAFARPWARILMSVLSPTLVTMGAAKRWAAFHRGSELVPKKAEQEGARMFIRGTLSYPPGLFNELLLRRYGKAFEAAILAGRGKNPASSIESSEPGRSVFLLSWDA